MYNINLNGQNQKKRRSGNTARINKKMCEASHGISQTMLT